MMQQAMDDSRGEPHAASYSTYVIVWAALVVLTGITVGAHHADMAHVAVLTAILIATAKASLVLLYFMHLRYEKRYLAVMVIAVLIIYAVFLILTFSDYLFRNE